MYCVNIMIPVHRVVGHDEHNYTDLHAHAQQRCNFGCVHYYRPKPVDTVLVNWPYIRGLGIIILGRLIFGTLQYAKPLACLGAGMMTAQNFCSPVKLYKE